MGVIEGALGEEALKLGATVVVGVRVADGIAGDDSLNSVDRMECSAHPVTRNRATKYKRM